jgi:hypothetical protein
MPAEYHVPSRPDVTSSIALRERRRTGQQARGAITRYN